MAADRGRDLRVSILSDASKFDLSDAASDLDRLADNASDTARGLDRLDAATRHALEEQKDLARAAGASEAQLADLERQALDAARDMERLATDTKDTGQDVETFGKDAKATAEKVEASFKQIGDASRRGLRDVEDASDRAEGKLAEVGEEGIDTAREMGASFSGSADDIADAFQEVAANALQAFGPLGIGVGVALAAGIGMIRAAAEKTKQAVSDLTSALFDLGGSLDDAALAERIRELAESGDLADLKHRADALGVSFRDLARARAGDTQAAERALRAVDAQLAAFDDLAVATGGLTQEQAERQAQLVALQGDLRNDIEVHRLATEAIQNYADATGQSVEDVERLAAAQESLNESFDGFVDPVNVYTGLLAEKEEAERQTAEATAAATEDQSDSWEDYAKDVAVSVDEYLAELERQILAQEEWATNLAALAERGVNEGVLQNLARLGPEGAPLVADLVNASDQELRRLNDLSDRESQATADAIITNLRGVKEPVRASQAEAAAAAAAEWARAAAAGFDDAERAWSAAGARLAGQAAAAAQAEANRRPITYDVNFNYNSNFANSRELTARLRP